MLLFCKPSCFVQKRRMADKAVTEDNGFLGHKKVSRADHWSGDRDLVCIPVPSSHSSLRIVKCQL